LHLWRMQVWYREKDGETTKRGESPSIFYRS
jgi:hypothetical protein